MNGHGYNNLVNDKLITIRHLTIVAARKPENNNADVQKEPYDHPTLNRSQRRNQQHMMTNCG
ncbi:hypothetical protein L4D09_27705 [Photobacterium makurazakiensis]